MIQVQWAFLIKTIHFARWKCSYNAGGLKDLCLLQWRIVWDISQWFHKNQISCLDGLVKHGTLYTVHSITCIMFPPSQQFCLNKMLLLSKLLSLCVNKSSAFMGREVTGTDLRPHQSHIPKQNVTLQGVIIHHDHNHIVIGCLIKHMKCFRIILLYIKGMTW